MNRIRNCFAACVLTLLLNPIARGDAGDVIPRPVDVKESTGQFTLSKNTKVFVGSDAKDIADTAKQLVNLLDKPLDADLQIARGNPSGNSVLLTTADADASLGDEGYTLSVKPDSITIRATTATGLFYGIQTLRQLLPPQIESKQKVSDVAWTIPCMEIKDSPRFGWRGLMLDVARHFEDKAEVEQLLDLMAMYKLNVFHWHLVDDQGWRIEIKKYPKLTEIGAWRDAIGFKLDPKRSTHYRADGKYGGFYTQDEIREVVAYAAKLHITIVPEIEMPGHASAALVAYPQFGTTKAEHPEGVTMKPGVLEGIYDPTLDDTYNFLSDILTEVTDLFPGPFIHIGGDEVPKGPWKKSAECQAFMKAHDLKDENELQSYFVKKMEKIVESKHRRLIGWDEILEGGLAPGAAVMSWRGVSGGIEAAKQDHDVVMTPTTYFYFDYGQTHLKGEPITIGGYLPLSKVYSYDPIARELTPEQAKHVLGAQGNVWTEYMPNLAQVEHMAFPRTCALAEIAWSPKDRKDYKDFLRRLEGDEKHLTVLGVPFFNDPNPDPATAQIGEWKPAQMKDTYTDLHWEAGKTIAKPGKYAVTFQYTDGGCRLDIKSVALLADGAEIARDTHDGITGASDKKNVYRLEVPAGKEGTKYTVVASVRSDGGTDSNGTVTVVMEP